MEECMESENFEVFKPIYGKLTQAAEESHVDADYLANAMIDVLCDELQRPKSAGLRLTLQEKVLNYENLFFMELVNKGLIGVLSKEKDDSETP
jgi:hypothetical protein